MTSSDGTQERQVIPVSINFRQSMQEPSTLEMLFESHWNYLHDEDSATNVCQLNSYVVWYKKVAGAEVTKFRGYVVQRDMVEMGEGEQMIRVICSDPLAKLWKTIASVSGEHVFTKETPYDEITQKALKQATAIGDTLYPFYPTPGAGGDGDPWLEVTEAWNNSTTLGTGMDSINTYAVIGVSAGAGGTFTIDLDKTAFFKEGLQFKITGSTDYENDGTWTVASSALVAGDTVITVSSAETVGAVADGTITLDSIKASESYSDMLPMGFLRIESEWVQYDGYDQSDLNKYYIFKNITRGALGTTAASHVITTAVYQRVSQKIHPAMPVKLEAQRNGGARNNEWDIIPGEQYAVQPEEGRFDLNYDIANWVDTADAGFVSYDNFRASYAVFDEDHASAVDLKEIFNDVLTATVANGGPGLGAGDISLNANLENIRLTRIRVTEPVSSLQFIHNLLDEIGYNKDEDEAVIGIWYDHETGKVNAAKINQVDLSVSHSFMEAVNVDRGVDIDEVYSAVLVKYTSGQNQNLISHDRMWHPDTSDNVGDNTESPTHVAYQDEEQPMLDGWTWDATSSNNLHTNRLTDGFATSGWGLRFGANPGPNSILLYCWFDDSANTYLIDEVEVIVDCRRHSHSTNPVHVMVKGAESYTVENNPSPTLTFISGALNKEFAGSKHLDAINKLKLHAEDIGWEGAAIAIVYDGMATWKGTQSGYGNTNMRLGLVKSIKVIGQQVKTKLVQITNDYKLSADYLWVKAATYNKLIDANLGQPRVQILDIGQASEDTAQSLGRLALLQSLILEQSRNYEIQHGLDDIPQMGDKVTCVDYTGLCLGVDYTSIGGEEVLNLRVVNFDAGLI
jgi:hypothetical protein